MNKRHNPYNIEDVMKKHFLSYDDALERIEKLKSKTSGTLENFIKRHGKTEGVKKFQIFKDKSSHTEEKYRLKYGDDWEIKWDKYLKSKSSGREALISKHGEIEGVKKFEEYNDKRKKSGKKENLILKHGKEKYEDIINSKKSGSLESLILKYGEEEGKIKYKEINIKKTKYSTLDGLIEKYGETEGVERYERRRITSSPIFQQLKNKYGTEKALVVYQTYKDKRLIAQDHNLEKININKKKVSRFSKMSDGCVSKESDSFFKELENFLRRPLIYGSKKIEHKLFDDVNMKQYYFDCYDSQSNTLIEFHGIAYHPKMGDFGWISPFGRTYEEVLNYDTLKKNFALNSGYNYLVVYSDDVKLKHYKITKIKEISEILNT